MKHNNRALLTGSLSFFSPQEVLQWVGHHGGEGLLVFDIPADWRAFHGRLSVHFKEAELVSLRLTDPHSEERSVRKSICSSPAPGTLGGLLVDRKIILNSELRYGLSLQETIGQKQKPPLLGEILQGLGLLSPDSLAGSLKDLAVSYFAELFRCQRGSFAVYRGQLEKPFLPVNERIDHILLRAAYDADQAPLESSQLV